jgi:hypothetical protein
MAIFKGSYFYYGNYYTHALHTYMSTDAFVPKVKPEHVISFGDAIFAFAITLMTLSIDIPIFIGLPQIDMLPFNSKISLP